MSKRSESFFREARLHDLPHMQQAGCPLDYLRWRREIGLMCNAIGDDGPLPTTEEVKRVLALAGIHTADLENYRAVEGFRLSEVSGLEVEEMGYRFGVLAGTRAPRTAIVDPVVARDAVDRILDRTTTMGGFDIVTGVMAANAAGYTITGGLFRDLAVYAGKGNAPHADFPFFAVKYNMLTTEYFGKYCKLLSELIAECLSEQDARMHGIKTTDTPG